MYLEFAIIIDRVLKTCSTCLDLYIHYILMLRIFISLDTLFFTRTLHRFTASIYFLQGNSTAAAGIQKSGFNRHEFPEK